MRGEQRLTPEAEAPAVGTDASHAGKQRLQGTLLGMRGAQHTLQQ